MRRIQALIVGVAVAIAVACGSSGGGGGGMKADAAIDSSSFCGHPGDPGNNIGVGKYCNSIADCSGNSAATLCATLGNPDAHFCTTVCSMTGSAGQCGTDATCQCQSGQCGCFPNSCGSGS